MCKPGEPCPGMEELDTDSPGGMMSLILAALTGEVDEALPTDPEEKARLADAMLFEMTDNMIRFMKHVSSHAAGKELLDSEEAKGLHKILTTTIIYKMAVHKPHITVIRANSLDEAKEMMRKHMEDNATSN